VASSKNQEREAREARDRLKRYTARQTVHSTQVKRRKRDNLVAVAGVVVIAALAAVTQVFYFTAGPGAPEPTASASATAEVNVGDIPDSAVAESRTWTGQLTLNDIPLAIALDGAAAPQAVSSFVTDAQDGFLVGKTCHRLVAETTAALIQCGSTNGDGAGDADYQFGPIENAPSDEIYPAGTIAIARADTAYTQGHQFFITLTDSTLPSDTGGYSVIGTVTSGLDALISGVAAGGVVDGATDGAPVIATTITGLTVQ
jgi:peptidyl-prolyl cis-trans isomerase B (cyclophilin B)